MWSCCCKGRNAKNSNEVFYAGFKYEVSVDQTEITIDPEHKAATVTITNQEEEEEESESEAEQSEAPKTGDETPVAPYAGLMAIAFTAMVILILSEERRRANKK